jgi:hypothetical protein
MRERDGIEFAIDADEATRTVTITMTCGGRSTSKTGRIDFLRKFAYEQFESIMKTAESITRRRDVETVKQGIMDYLEQVEAHFKTLN